MMTACVGHGRDRVAARTGLSIRRRVAPATRARAKTLIAANNYAHCLLALQHYAEAKGLLRKIVPVARRVLGDSHQTTLLMRWSYAEALYKDGSGSLGELREAVTTLEEIERVEQRVLGGAHPTTLGVEDELRDARAALRANEETQP